MNDQTISFPTAVSQTTPQDEVSGRAYIEDGILYTEYVGEFSVPAAYKVEKQAIELLKEKKIGLIPCIVVMKNVKLKISMKDYAKVISFDLIKYISAVWVVGLSGEARRIGQFINKVFLKDRMNFVDSLQEAQASARVARTQEEALLEKE